MEALATFPSDRDVLLSVQINGNYHPTFLFDKVPSIPCDGSWCHENQDPPCAGHSEKTCVLQFWHPYFIDQYSGMLQAYSKHLAAHPQRKQLLGIRMNYDAVGTEGTGCPHQICNNESEWLVPKASHFVPLNSTSSRSDEVCIA
jgi:hypothetical protein